VGLDLSDPQLVEVISFRVLSATSLQLIKGELFAQK